MPTYEYECTSCGQHIEVFQRISEDALTTCGVCGGTLRKVFHPAGIVFKGSGFYATDSRSSSKTGSKRDGEGSSSSSSSSDGSSKTSESKGSDGSSKGSEGGSSKGSEGGSSSSSSSSSKAKESSSS
jgi:putative FmdB family regulatory protein